MKHLLSVCILFPFLLSAQQQDSEGNYVLRYYADIVALRANAPNAEGIRICLWGDSMDSCMQSGVDLGDFSKLKKVHIATLSMRDESLDDRFEVWAMQQLVRCPELEWLWIEGNVRHDFTGFNSLRTLWIDGEGCAGNPTLKSLAALEELHLPDYPFAADDPVFSLAGLRRIQIGYYDHAGMFPYGKLSLFPQLEEIELFLTDARTIPASWAELQHLRYIYLHNREIDSVPGFFCELPEFRYLNLQCGKCPAIAPCVLSDADMEVYIEIFTEEKNEQQKTDRYAAQVPRRLQKRIEISWYDRDDFDILNPFLHEE